MINVWTGVGNLTSDPELKFIGDDSRPVANFSVALSERRKVNGVWEDAPPTFVEVSLFGGWAKHLCENAKKGTQVAVKGRLKLDRWQDKNGDNRQKLCVVADAAIPMNRLKVHGPQDAYSESYSQPVASAAPSGVEVPF